MRVRFWGVRGSVPYGTSSSMGHGCNTPCVEVVDEAASRRLILDAGSGIVGVGERLQDAGAIAIALTHYHWDHVQGIPFFAPLHRLGAAVTVWAPALDRRCPIEQMFDAPFFPRPFHRLPSPPSLRMITEGFVAINGFDMAVLRLNHPGGSFAYRIAGDGGSLVYATDHEFGNAVIDRSLKEFAAGAHALILDSHFTPEELPLHEGWGHGDWEQCARFAGECGARHLWLFHHRPGRSDVEMTQIEEDARRIFPGTTAAREGIEFEV